MKRVFLLIVIVLFVTGCKTNKYDGYWCSYKESTSLVILLNHDISDGDRQKLENLIESFEYLDNYDYLSRESLLVDNIDISNVYDTYFVYLSSSKNIDSYLDSLNDIKGVFTVNTDKTKNDMKLYKLENGKYEYRETLYDDSINGKFKVKKNTISFDNDKVSKLYVKDDFLCADSECLKILVKTDQLCESIPD